MILIVIYSVLLLFLFILLGMLIKKTVKEKGNKTKTKTDTINKLITEIIPLAQYDSLHDCILLQDGSCMDFLQIRSKDLNNASPDSITYDRLRYTKLYKKYPDDIKIIITNFPTDTSEQQAYVRHKISTTKNTIQKKWLNKKLEEIIWLENNRTCRSFYYMIFGKDAEELMKRRDIFTSTLGTDKDGLIIIIDEETKVAILRKLNNKNACIMKRGEI